MDKTTFKIVEEYMLKSMHDSAHDTLHIYRVLGQALSIAKSYQDIDYDVLITACLLHDIGRDEQFENPELDHAAIGGEKAAVFLRTLKWDENKISHVKNCIQAHRWRNSISPETLEAKILFDADKLDAAGPIGICRTLIYNGQVGEPLYAIDSEGRIMEEDAPESFFKEFSGKLTQVYDCFYTIEAREIAKEQKKAAFDFYDFLKTYVEKTNGLVTELAEHLS